MLRACVRLLPEGTSGAALTLVQQLLPPLQCPGPGRADGWWGTPACGHAHALIGMSFFRTPASPGGVAVARRPSTALPKAKLHALYRRPLGRSCLANRTGSGVKAQNSPTGSHGDKSPVGPATLPFTDPHCRVTMLGSGDQTKPAGVWAVQARL